MSVLDKYETPTRTVRLTVASDQDAIEEAQGRLRAARLSSDSGSLADESPALEDALAVLRQMAEDNALVFTFEALSAEAMEALMVAHPTTDKAKAFNVLTFGPALLAESCIKAGDDDGLTLDEATKLWSAFSEGDCQALFGAAWGVATTANLRPFSVTDTDSKDQPSEKNSTTAPPEALHIAGS